MHHGEYRTTISHWLEDGTIIYGPHEVVAKYTIISGDVNNDPVYEYEITRDGEVFYSGKIRSTLGRQYIFERYTDLCLGVR